MKRSRLTLTCPIGIVHHDRNTNWSRRAACLCAIGRDQEEICNTTSEDCLLVVVSIASARHPSLGLSHAFKGLRAMDFANHEPSRASRTRCDGGHPCSSVRATVLLSVLHTTPNAYCSVKLVPASASIAPADVVVLEFARGRVAMKTCPATNRPMPQTSVSTG